MDVVLLSLAILLLAVFVAAPLYRRSPPEPPARDEDAEAHRQAVDRALGDLEIDLGSGLIDEAGYERERRSLRPAD